MFYDYELYFFYTEDIQVAGSVLFAAFTVQGKEEQIYN